MGSKSRHYHVSGVDGDGDVHTYSTDDRERAEAMLKTMGEDLEQVALHEGRSSCLSDERLTFWAPPTG